ncbi:hypothetical protein H0H81_007406 [Sphagnurus paluster]|uniref:Uncharacterized protein n=1 Tax=Sphagnurus paluster TaxID=117069 RepID=A0A9P7GFQ1_9AGAR|nr:hypothetical protein H0H81_007406 [Sphagnurus paluster]
MSLSGHPSGVNTGVHPLVPPGVPRTATAQPAGSPIMSDSATISSSGTTSAASNGDASHSAGRRASASMFDDEEENVSGVGLTTSGTNLTGNERLLQIMSAFALLPREDQEQFLGVMAVQKRPASTSVPVASAPALYSAAREEPSQTDPSARKFGFHECLRILALHGQHIPLTMFLSELLRKLAYGRVPLEKIHLASGIKVAFVKTEAFPDEEKMDTAEWMEGWTNYKDFMKAQGAEDSVYARWVCHYDYLSSRRDFKANFPTILRFDIEQRKQYVAHPVAYCELAYLAAVRATLRPVRDVLGSTTKAG